MSIFGLICVAGICIIKCLAFLINCASKKPSLTYYCKVYPMISRRRILKVYATPIYLESWKKHKKCANIN